MSRGDRRPGLPVAATLVLALLAAAPAPGQEDAVRESVSAFYAALESGQTATAEALVHVDARYFSARNDKLIQMPLRLWVGRAGDRGAARVRSVEVAGVTAAVTVVRGQGAAAVIEHLLLIRYNGHWGIVGLTQGSAD